MDLAALFGDISAGLSQQFGGPYFAGAVIAQATPGGYDDDGNYVSGTPATDRTCLVQIDAATEAMRQAEGFADGDVRLIILASSLTGGLDTDAKVSVSAGPYAGTTWSIAGLSRDPFAATWVGKGHRA